MNVPFNRIKATWPMVEALTKSLGSSVGFEPALSHWSGDGPYTQLVLEKLSGLIPDSMLLMTTSASQALEMAVALSGIGPGDEVILPSYTYASCANAILSVGATPVFAAVTPETLCLDPNSVERLLSPKVKAVMPVHYGGVPVDLGALMALCQAHELTLIEDAAQAIGSTWHGRALGSIGDFGAISFHDTKNLTSGEGGLLLVNASKQAKWDQAQIYHQKGTDRLQFLKGQRDRYEWVGPGVSASPSELLMALLSPQLDDLEAINGRRRAIVRRYEAVLGATSVPEILSFTKDDPSGNGHLFFVRFRASTVAGAFMAFMQSRGIDVRTHYQPLHASPYGRAFRCDQALFSGRDSDLGKCVVRLPMSHHLEDSEIEYVCEVLKDALIHSHTGL
ncbi:aminotransferase class I/II-fold pyridoxal phosphate-dependent enzyme [Acidaminobacter sp.]|uniref:aminotransferase class I/II-fold pyridoxal phosphate-dependent enzyme n=1 Tax=Acidaminobacter sp. TaxID=1872102 RepID=UPI002564954D|nr:aminotransferase class I/II-fold pyridoxal phosphate-dependent enzyme [Acidaminobacter sp.]MDK9710085.1 aminotransferase class I/II-fold pyridoxal phosphate-dependent enzyme [Acidaminobacter sp.]